MERKRRTRQRVKISLAKASYSLSLALTWSKSLILLVSIFIFLPIHVNGQAQVLCSGNMASFEEYEPIKYPIFPRRAGVQRRFTFELVVMPGGKFDHKLLNPVAKATVAYELQEAVLKSFSGWRLTNNSNEIVALKLNVIFELAGKVEAEDDIVKNKISFDHDVITIRVAATQFIPRLTE